MLRLLPVALLAACSFSHAGGNHRPVGNIDSPIADAGSLTHVEIVSTSGRIDVRPAGAGGAGVKVEVLLNEDRPVTDFDDDFAKHVEVVRQGERLTIRNRHSDQSDHDDWRLRFNVMLPAGISLDIHQVAGTVGVQLPRARDVAIDNTAGTVEVVIPTIEGRLSVTSQAGNIDLAIADRGPSDGCSLDCTAGNITLQLPQNVDGEFDLAASVGNVSVGSRFGLPIKRAITSASAKGTVGQGGPVFRAHGVTGNISVR